MAKHKIIRISEAMETTGLTRSTLYLRIAQKNFPTPINLGGRAVGWLESDIQQWIEEQITASRKGAI